jgi:cysteine-rich repeat protein
VSWFVRFAVAVAMVLVSTSEMRAEPLLTRSGRAAPLAGLQRAAGVTLGRAALAALRMEGGAARVDEFPLGASRLVTLELRRFAPLGPRTRVEVMEGGGPRRIAMPDAAYFTGGVAGEPGSRAIVVATVDTVHGFVASAGEVYRFGPDAAGSHRTYALADVDPGEYPPPGAFCVNDAHPELDLVTPPVAAAPAVAAAGLRVAQIAIETDRELRQKFPSDEAALDYLGDLLAAASAIYERDVGVRLTFSYIRLWGASVADPWTATDPSAALDEVRAYWLNAAKNMATIAGPRDLVHFLSGKQVRGGVAYVNALCNQTYGFGVSQVHGGFDLASPSNIWDVMVLTHEVGHNFGSPHTHCYSPPIDRCYNAEPGCYAGPVVSSRGTIMSYCHLTGGLSSIDLVFGGTVTERMAPSVQAASCLTVDPPVCGNHLVESGEQCDDGNRTSGDCCSASCLLEVCASTTTTSSTSTSTSRPPTTSTTRPSTTSTIRPSTTSTTAPRPSTTTTSSSTSTSTTAPATGDGDGDGVPDAVDACPATAPGELVDASGCPVCPCQHMRDGTPWASRFAFLRCVRGEVRRRAQVEGMSRATMRALARQTRLSTCGSAGLTRCCVYGKAGAVAGECHVLRPARCDANRQRAVRVLDLGPGICAQGVCGP